MMKKRLLGMMMVLVAVILVLGFVGCSGKKESPTQSQASQSAPVAEQSTTTLSPTVTVASYLAQFGLTENDIKPEGFVSFEGPDGWLIKINAGSGQFDAWGKNVFERITAISTDGKVYQQGYPVLGNDEAEWSAGSLMFQWAYPYNGKVVNIDVLPGDTGTVYRLSIH